MQSNLIECLQYEKDSHNQNQNLQVAKKKKKAHGKF